MAKQKNVMSWSIIVITLITVYFLIGYASSYFGWYGYKKWQYRVGTSNIIESRQRKVFVRELYFQIDNFPGRLDSLRVYIEKGFRYGHNSENETFQLINSNYPYQLSFSYNRLNGVSILLSADQLNKFDSSNATQGFLKFPKLKDTIIANIVGGNSHSGIIRIWQ